MNITSSPRKVFTSVQDVILPSTGPQPNLTPVVVGQLSMRVFLGPLTDMYVSFFAFILTPISTYWKPGNFAFFSNPTWFYIAWSRWEENRNHMCCLWWTSWPCFQRGRVPYTYWRTPLCQQRITEVHFGRYSFDSVRRVSGVFVMQMLCKFRNKIPVVVAGTSAGWHVSVFVRVAYVTFYSHFAPACMK